MQRSLQKWLLLFLSFYSNVTVSRKPAFLTQCKDFQCYRQWHIYLFTCLSYAPYPPLHKRGEPIFFTAESLWILAWWQVINKYTCFVYYTCTFALQFPRIILQWEYHLESTWKALPKDHCVPPLRACYIKKKKNIIKMRGINHVFWLKWHQKNLSLIMLSFLQRLENLVSGQEEHFFILCFNGKSKLYLVFTFH